MAQGKANRSIPRQLLIDKIKAGEKGWAIVSHAPKGGDEFRAVMSLTVVRSGDVGIQPIRIPSGEPNVSYPAGRQFVVPVDALWMFVELAEEAVAKACDSDDGRVLTSAKSNRAPVGANAA